jgi:hypothetical protein
MAQSSEIPERVAEATAHRLLGRAAALDADGLNLEQLREAAAEAGISHGAFDAAVAEWRAEGDRPASAELHGSATPALLRNAASLASGWLAVAVLASAQRLVAAPWLVHKLTDPIGLAVGAIIAARLRARTATIILGGLAVSQGAEFLMDLASGAPSIHGFGAHVALMIAGIAGVAIGTGFLGRTQGPKGDAHADERAGRETGLTNTEIDERFLESMRLRRTSDLARLQPA